MFTVLKWFWENLYVLIAIAFLLEVIRRHVWEGVDMYGTADDMSTFRESTQRAILREVARPVLILLGIVLLAVCYLIPPVWEYVRTALAYLLPFGAFLCGYVPLLRSGLPKKDELAIGLGVILAGVAFVEEDQLFWPGLVPESVAILLVLVVAILAAAIRKELQHQA
jgi:hypothetical protein